MLAHIHPSQPWFTCRTRPYLMVAVIPALLLSGAGQGPPGAQSPFARIGCYPLRHGVSHHIRGRYPSFIALTNSCARPNPSH